MNARQKAKYYKKKCEQLENRRLMQTIIYDKPTVTYKCSKIVADIDKDFPHKDFVERQMLFELADKMKELVDTEYQYCLGGILITKTIRVVMK